MRLEPGMLVKSKAGRDKDHIYVAVCIQDGYVYVADGDTRPLRRMKRKNSSHLQPIRKIRLGMEPEDAAIREIIRQSARQGETV